MIIGHGSLIMMMMVSTYRVLVSTFVWTRYLEYAATFFIEKLHIEIDWGFQKIYHTLLQLKGLEICDASKLKGQGKFEMLGGVRQDPTL